ncbi:MAG: DUF4160 domain-containing protein, partial [Blastocatellia bacterium]
MPTIWKEAGFQFIIYRDDHPPAHVHAFKSGAEAVVNLGSKSILPSLRDVYRMKPRDARKALGITCREQ